MGVLVETPAAKNRFYRFSSCPRPEIAAMEAPDIFFEQMDFGTAIGATWGKQQGLNLDRIIITPNQVMLLDGMETDQRYPQMDLETIELITTVAAKRLQQGSQADTIHHHIQKKLHARQLTGAAGYLLAQINPTQAITTTCGDISLIHLHSNGTYDRNHWHTHSRGATANWVDANDSPLKPATDCFTLQPHDYLLAYTDGLDNLFKPDEILAILADNPQANFTDLIAQAETNNKYYTPHPDDISVFLYQHLPRL